MREVFRIEVCNLNHEATLSLPLTDYELLDAMDKINMVEGDRPSIEVYQFSDGMDGLEVVLEDDLNLFELNELAKRLSAFQLEDKIAFHALVSTELEKGEDSVPLKRLIDLAYSTDCCDVYPGVMSYEELGHFCVESDMVPELNGLSERALDLLDYERIGKKSCQLEGGILDPGGYVIQTSELKEVAKNMTFAPPTPNYAILLEISKGYFNDPTYDNEKTIALSLPAEPGEMEAALDSIGAWDWREVGFRCLDCTAPTLIPHIGSEDNIAHINRLAQKLQTMDGKALMKFKAVLDATKDCSVLGATQIAYNLDDYLFSPQYASPEDMARDYLIGSMGESCMSTLLPHINLSAYGKALMDEQECVLTDYGMISREDGQALESLKPSAKQVQHGMGEITM